RRDAAGNFLAANTEPPSAIPVQGQYSVLGQQLAGISFAPACNCWRLDILGRLPPPSGQFRGVTNPPATNPGLQELSTFQWRFPDILFLLTIQNFGTFGAGG